MRKILWAIATLAVSYGAALSQNDLSIFHTHIPFDSTKTKQLLFQLENHNFFKNNEYFGDIVEGYTLPGYSFEPALVYYPSSVFRIKAGFHYRQFHGSQKNEDIFPVLAAQLMLTKNLSVTFGALKGHVHHNLPEPMLNPEWQINRPVETGLQFLLNSNRFTGDLWIDWYQFIKPNDTIPEKFVAGLSGSWMLNDREAAWHFSLPVMMTATHRGGQISNYNQPMESLANLGTGLNAVKTINTKNLKKIGLSINAFFYKDLTDKKERPMNSGFAVYPAATISTRWGEFMTGWWHGSDYYSPRGNPLFNSVSTYLPDYYEKNRDLVTLKYNLNKVISKQLKFNFGVEGFLDAATGTLEYFYAVNLIFTPSFKILTINHLE